MATPFIMAELKRRMERLGAGCTKEENNTMYFDIPDNIDEEKLNHLAKSFQSNKVHLFISRLTSHCHTISLSRKPKVKIITPSLFDYDTK